jgi:hypothetical protein
MHKTNGRKFVGNWLSTPSKLDLGDGALLGDPVLAKLFVQCNIPVPSNAAVERFFKQQAKRDSLSDENFNILMFMRGNRHLWKEK